MFPASWVGRLGYFQLTSDLLVWLIKSDQTGRTSILHNNNSLPLGSPSTKELHGRVKHLVAKVFLGLLVGSFSITTYLSLYQPLSLPTYLGRYSLWMASTSLPGFFNLSFWLFHLPTTTYLRNQPGPNLGNDGASKPFSLFKLFDAQKFGRQFQMVLRSATLY